MRRTRQLLGAAVVLVLACTPADAQSPEETERLALLGQVWGFVKYFHPGVATGTINWDSALVATVPRVRAARTSEEYDATLQALLDAAGPVRPCLKRNGNGDTALRCRSEAHDSLRKNLDLRWLTESKAFGPAIARQLVTIRNERHRGTGRYVSFTNTAVFQADTAYSAPEYPDEGVRLLALFRFWSAARYYFPYMYVNGGDWNTVLPEFIPRLIAVTNAEEYHLTLLELTARLHDAHVGASSRLILRALGGRSPGFEARSIEGRIVVWKIPRGSAAEGSGLQVGDVIWSVDGEPVAQRRRDLAKYIAAGNPAVFERKLVFQVMRGNEDFATYTIERDDRILTLRVPMTPRPDAAPVRPTYPVAELAWVLPDTDIGYINMGDINPAQVDSALAIVRNTSGIVMDVRNYPRGTMHLFAQFFNPEARPFVKFTMVDSTYPGQVVWTPLVMTGRREGNPGYYRGRVAILVDERTQSHAEFSVMALRTAPENKVIGSQTAGADGNITTFMLPGGVRTGFTGLGVYYPDGTPTQRIGIVPDIEIRPTLAGLRAGRDEVLERALEYIRTGR